MVNRRPPDGCLAAARHRERLARFRHAGLYVVTSQLCSRGRCTLAIVRATLAGGACLVQLREKEMPLPALVRLAQAVRRLTAAAGALLIINDRLDVALAVGADGVHLGQDDLPAALARRLAPDLLIGVSTHNAAEIAAARAAGASYVNIGPLFATRTRAHAAPPLGLTGLRRLAPGARLPYSVMGGIKPHHIPDLLACGARTIAVVTAVTAAPDPAAATRHLLRLIERN